MVNFPAPIGGTALRSDFAPSVLFAVLYGLLVPVLAYRLFHRRSRSTLLIGTAAFSIERIVIFSLRAMQAHSESQSLSVGLVKYMQISFGTGFIGIASDLVQLLRCLLVNPTYGSETYPQSPAAASKESHVAPPPAGTRDQPKLRFWSRRFCGFSGLAFLAASVPGIIAGTNYSGVFNDQNKADATANLRVLSSAIALGLTLLLFAVALAADRSLPRISKAGVKIICSITTLVSIVAIYRLSVMHQRTTSLTAPSPLNTPRAKAGFYIFHVLPEWLATVVLFGANIRKTLGTGLLGDWRFRDETEKERKKREEKEEKKRQKKSKKRTRTLMGADGSIEMSLVDREKKNDTLVTVQD